MYYYSPPFSHIELAWNPMPLIYSPESRLSAKEVREIQDNVQCGHLRAVTCTAHTNGVRVLWRAFQKQEYYFLRIPVSFVALQVINDTAMSMFKRQDTYFSTIAMLRAALCPRPPPHLMQTGWFCSQLVCFLLQEAGLLPSEINASAIHPNDLFVACVFFLSGEGCNNPVDLLDPPRMASATLAYCHFRNLDSNGVIPIEDLRQIPEIARVLVAKMAVPSQVVTLQPQP